MTYARSPGGFRNDSFEHVSFDPPAQYAVSAVFAAKSKTIHVLAIASTADATAVSSTAAFSGTGSAAYPALHARRGSTAAATFATAATALAAVYSISTTPGNHPDEVSWDLRCGSTPGEPYGSVLRR